MADTPRNVRNAIKSFVPNWLSDQPVLNIGFSVLFIIALTCDFFIEQLFQGVLAALPGQGDPTTLAYIGRSRGLIRGLSETDASYIARLIGWLGLWNVAGGAETLVLLIQAYLGNNLVVRLVDRAGNFVTANADGTTTKIKDINWDWDSGIAATYGQPSRVSFWGDTWLIVYTTDGRWPVYTSRSDPAFLAAWGTYNGLGSGHQVPRAAVDGVYQILASFKGAHTWMVALMFTDDTTQFVPLFLGFPDGQEADWSREIAGVRTPDRTTATGGGHYIRYWIPPFGG